MLSTIIIFLIILQKYESEPYLLLRFSLLLTTVNKLLTYTRVLMLFFRFRALPKQLIISLDLLQPIFNPYLIMRLFIKIIAWTFDNDSRLGIPLQGNWECPWIGTFDIMYTLSFPLVSPQKWFLLWCSAYPSTKHLALRIFSKMNNQIIQRGFYFFQNLVYILGIIIYIILYFDLLENLMVDCVFLYISISLF